MVAGFKVKNRQDEKFKIATAKIKHILHNINHLKLNNKFISRLEVPKYSGSKSLFCGSPKCLVSLILLCLLGFGAIYVYIEYFSSKVKARPLGKDEVHFLLDQISKHKALTTRATNASNNKLKEDAWKIIAQEFTAMAGETRRPEQLRLKWENLKKAARKRTAMIRSNNLKHCVLELPHSIKSFFRPPEDCSMCKHVFNVVRLNHTSAQEFEHRYAEGMTPVIVTDATDGWKAINEFNFQFFADFYRNGKRGRKTNECFYFAYKSGLNSLREVFSMDEARANLSGDPWYVGWSTCYDEETRALRQFYSRPYFLPTTSESDSVDWIFMGGPGQGAPLHLDSVRHVSWQAQVRGRKRWQLAPPHECTYSCQPIEFLVAPAEILVVNTNWWYHSTSVLPGDISITIGAEFD